MENLQDVDLEKLNEQIKDSGLKIKYIADELGLTYQSVMQKRRGVIPWRKLEKEKLIVILGMSEEVSRQIFLK